MPEQSVRRDVYRRILKITGLSSLVILGYFALHTIWGYEFIYQYQIITGYFVINIFGLVMFTILFSILLDYRIVFICFIIGFLLAISYGFYPVNLARIFFTDNLESKLSGGKMLVWGEPYWFQDNSYKFLMKSGANKIDDIHISDPKYSYLQKNPRCRIAFERLTKNYILIRSTC